MLPTGPVCPLAIGVRCVLDRTLHCSPPQPWMYAGPGLGRRKTSTGPQTSSFSSTAVQFSPGLNWCCPVTQNYKQIGKIDAAMMSRPSCHRHKICTVPHTSSPSSTANKVLLGLGCCRPVIQNYKIFGKLDAAVWSMRSCHRRLICAGPHTTLLSGTSQIFMPGFCCCVPDIHVHHKHQQLGATVRSRPSCHRRKTSTGPKFHRSPARPIDLCRA